MAQDVCALAAREATHWTGHAVAAGNSLRSVQRIWAAHELQPRRIRTFERSRDPAFPAAKLEAIVGLHIAPPRHAVVPSVDVKPQIQALDRTRPGLPVKPGRCATMTYDYGRHGTTTLFAALNVPDGTALGRCMQRHRRQEFLRFLNVVEAAVPAGTAAHAILDDYGTHKHPKVLARLGRHPRRTFHPTPTPGPWPDAIEAFFPAPARRRLRRGVSRPIVELQAAINRRIAGRDDAAAPFTWTETADRILPKLRGCWDDRGGARPGADDRAETPRRPGRRSIMEQTHQAPFIRLNGVVGSGRLAWKVRTRPETALDGGRDVGAGPGRGRLDLPAASS